MEASVIDLRKRMGEVMKAVVRGERVTLTYRGHPRALIVPLPKRPSEKCSIEELPAFGMWADRNEMEDPARYVEQLRKPRSI